MKRIFFVVISLFSISFLLYLQNKNYFNVIKNDGTGNSLLITKSRDMSLSDVQESDEVQLFSISDSLSDKIVYAQKLLENAQINTGKTIEEDEGGEYNENIIIKQPPQKTIGSWTEEYTIVIFDGKAVQQAEHYYSQLKQWELFSDDRQDEIIKEIKQFLEINFPHQCEDNDVMQGVNALLNDRNNIVIEQLLEFFEMQLACIDKYRKIDDVE